MRKNNIELFLRRSMYCEIDLGLFSGATYTHGDL